MRLISEQRGWSAALKQVAARIEGDVFQDMFCWLHAAMFLLSSSPSIVQESSRATLWDHLVGMHPAFETAGVPCGFEGRRGAGR